METQALPASLSWKTPVLLSFGVGLLILVSTGSMAGDLGGASLWIWAATACMGVFQSVLIYRFARKYPRKAGGTATYAIEAIPVAPRLWGGISMWGYWLAWTPGIIINTLLAAGYLKAAFSLPGNSIAWALGALVALYLAHYFGHTLNTKVIVAFSILALAPFAAVAVALLSHPLAMVNPNVFDFHAFTFALLMKWTFVTAWTAYGAEMASNLFAELKNPERDISRSLLVANIICVVLLVGLPLLMLLAVGPSALSQDPTVSLLPVGIKLFGVWGFKVISLAVAASLLLGAQAFIIGSSRTLYQMSVDGILPVGFQRLNSYGTPYRSIVWDLLVICLLLAAFKNKIIDIVAAANVGYIAVFVLLGLSAVVSARTLASTKAQHVLVIALGVFVFAANILLLLVGGWEWGREVFWIGFALLFTFVPLYWWRNRGNAVS